MKKIIYFLPFIFLLSGCGAPSEEEEVIAGQICTCYSMSSPVFIDMSHKYREEIYPLERKKILSNYKNNILIAGIQSRIEKLIRNYGSSEEKENNEKSYRVVVGFLRWETEQIRNLRSIDFTHVPSFSAVSKAQLEEMLKQTEVLRKHYLHFYKNMQREQDRTLAAIFQKDKEKFKKEYFGAYLLTSSLFASYDCSVAVLTRFLEEGGTLSSSELKKRVKEREPEFDLFL